MKLTGFLQNLKEEENLLKDKMTSLDSAIKQMEVDMAAQQIDLERKKKAEVSFLFELVWI